VAQGGWPVRRGLLAEQSRPHANDLWTLAGHVPSLDLRFSETKSLRDQVTGQNLVSFSRSSAGTFVDADGIIRSAAANEPRFDHDPATGRCLGLLVEEARTNACPYSVVSPYSWTTADNATIVPNAGIAPDGTFTAALVSFPASLTPRITRALTIGAGAVAQTVWIRAASSTVTIRVGNPSDFGVNQVIGTAWTRVTASIASGSNAFGVYCSNPVTAASFYVWGAQMELGSFPTSYIPTPATFTSRASTATFYDANGIIQTAATNIARSNAFFPNSNGVMVPAGLLLEAAATNLMPNSLLTNPVASSGGMTLENVTSLPGAFSSAVRLISSGGNDRRYNYGNDGNATTRTVSVYARLGTQGVRFFIRNGTGPYISFNLSTGVIEDNRFIAGSGRIENVGNGWYRCSFRHVNISGAGYLIGPASDSVLNSAAGDNIILTGFQSELGDYPTSYIPTAGSAVTRAADVSSSATVTRSADVAAITGRNFSSWYNNQEGTFVTDMALGFTQNAGNPFIFGGVFYTTVVNSMRTLSNADGLGGGLPNSQTVFSKMATGLKSGNYAISVNGTVVSGSRSVYTPAGNQWAINSSLGSLGRIKRLTYWPLRLPNATLQAITRPS
jgi:hypothetical protein